MATMKQTTSSTYFKLAEIECKTENLSAEDIRNILNESFGFVGCIYDEYSSEDIDKLLKDGFIDICEDGIIVWGA